MNIWTQMLSNQLPMSAATRWVVAQFLKTLIDFALSKNFSAKHLVGPGGMPSSCSATICGLTVAVPFKYGAGPFELAVSFVFSITVMYDTIGVRRGTEKQAKLLNFILSENPFKLNVEVLQRKLEEYMGHTPLQVLARAILGIGLALILNPCC